MKMAKSYKIIILLTAFVMSIILALGVSNFGVANAFTAPSSTSTYLEYISTDKVDLGEETLNITLDNENPKFGFKQLVIDDFEMNFSIEGATKLTMKLEYSSYLVNGVEKDGNFVKNVINSFDIDTTGDITLAITVEDDFPIVTVDDVRLDGETDDYYKIGYADKPVAKISFSVETDEQVKFALNYVDQKASDAEGNYKQFFTTEDGKLNDVDTYPRVNIDSSFFTKNESGEIKIIKSVSKQYAPKLTAYSVLNNVKTADLQFVSNDSSVKCLDNSKKIFFMSVKDGVDFAVTATDLNGAEVESYSANVIDPENTADTDAPVYVQNEEALKAYKNALLEATKDGDHYIALGTEIKLPSMADFVFDEYTAYDDLKVKVYYKNATETLTSDEMSFEVNEAGNYTVYVLFTDLAGNGMEVTDFIDENDAGEQYIVQDKYGAFIFNFYISDNAPIEVKAPTSKNVGYTGVKFTSPSFEVDANGCKTAYKLYYNTDKNATVPENEDALVSAGWVEIPKSSTITDKGYDKDGFSYEEIKAIGYDGELTFTPNAIGSYLIECSATSEVTHRSDTDYAVVNVAGAPQTVKVPSDWLQNNVWSVVFLSLGTLCLIGIVILLFIKPKDETEED